MICVIPFFQGDLHQAKDLLKWVHELGGCQRHDALLVTSSDLAYDQATEMVGLAEKSFRSVSLICSGVLNGWPQGPNEMFLTASAHCYQNEIGPWLFLEPDAIPLVEGWLDKIEAEYKQSVKRYMGNLVPGDHPLMPKVHMAGVGVYPWDAYRILSSLVRNAMTKAFDIVVAPVVVPEAHNTALIHHIWGETGRPPIFAERNVPHTEVFCPQQIWPTAVIFHRNKDGSLIRLLRQSKFGKVEEKPSKLAVVFSFHNKDASLMEKSMAWIREITPRLDRTAVLNYDANLDRSQFQRIRDHAHAVFSTVMNAPYPTPRGHLVGWPAACNYGFEKACNFIAQAVQLPFLWFEADAVAVKPDWFHQIEAEYFRGQLPFMGCIVCDFDGMKMGHMNGTGVYPPDATRYIPNALANPAYPWDAGMKGEMIHLCHPCNHLIQHCGAVFNCKCKPANGPQAKFPTQLQVDQLVEPSTVYFHPSKDGSLIDRLRERKR